MKLTTILIVFLVLALCAVLVAVAFFAIGGQSSSTSGSSGFSLVEFGSAGQSGYANFNYTGAGNVTLLSYSQPRSKQIFILRDPLAVDDSRFYDLVSALKPLEDYGYTVSVTNSTAIGHGIYVVPTGAIPSYVLTRLGSDMTNLTVIYMGSKDLLIGGGIKKFDWYSGLSDMQRSHFLFYYDGTLNQFLGNSNKSLFNDILYSSWQAANSTHISIIDSGMRAITTTIGDGSYLRLIYSFEDGRHGEYDSGALHPASFTLSSEPASIFPGESALLQFSLNKTNGTAFFSVKKNGVEIQHDPLRRVTDENVFIEKLQFDSPGDYVLYAGDNSGILASGITHVKSLNLKLLQHSGVQYLFSVALDGEPVDNAEAYVWLGNSSAKKKFFITNGILAVDAKLASGPNTFNVNALGTTLQFNVINNSDNALNFYVAYGIPGLLIVLIIYFGATFSRKPIYKIRFGEGSSYIRDEVLMTAKAALAAFGSARKDLHLGDSPLTPQEFSLGIRAYVTNGAEVTEGNVEGVLKKLVNKGYLENHRQYYQLKGEGDVKQNVLRRMIREKLIENGVSFKESGGKFITKDFEVGFFGAVFSKKALLVVDDEAEVRSMLASLDDSEKAKLRIKQSNNLLTFVPIDRFGDII